MNALEVLGRIERLERALDDALVEFYIPNERAITAVRAALDRPASRSLNRREWKRLYARVRKKIAKPPERNVEAAIKASNGKIFTGKSHGDAATDLIQARPSDYAYLNQTVKRAEKASGFRTNLQPFVGTEEATRIAWRASWRPGKEPWRKRARPGLHSSDLKDVPKG